MNIKKLLMIFTIPILILCSSLFCLSWYEQKICLDQIQKIFITEMELKNTQIDIIERKPGLIKGKLKYKITLHSEDFKSVLNKKTKLKNDEKFQMSFSHMIDTIPAEVFSALKNKDVKKLRFHLNYKIDIENESFTKLFSLINRQPEFKGDIYFSPGKEIKIDYTPGDIKYEIPMLLALEIKSPQTNTTLSFVGKQPLRKPFEWDEIIGLELSGKNGPIIGQVLGQNLSISEGMSNLSYGDSTNKMKKIDLNISFPGITWNGSQSSAMVSFSLDGIGLDDLKLIEKKFADTKNVDELNKLTQKVFQKNKTDQSKKPDSNILGELNFQSNLNFKLTQAKFKLPMGSFETLGNINLPLSKMKEANGQSKIKMDKSLILFLLKYGIENYINKKEKQAIVAQNGNQISPSNPIHSNVNTVIQPAGPSLQNTPIKKIEVSEEHVNKILENLVQDQLIQIEKDQNKDQYLLSLSYKNESGFKIQDKEIDPTILMKYMMFLEGIKNGASDPFDLTPKTSAITESNSSELSNVNVPALNNTNVVNQIPPIPNLNTPAEEMQFLQQGQLPQRAPAKAPAAMPGQEIK